MKRILRLLFIFLFFCFILEACEDDCGYCELVIEYSNGDVEREQGAEYCGVEYTVKKNSSPTTIAGTTSYWDCD